VLQQHSHRDPLVQRELGQMGHHRGVQSECALGHQFQHQGRGESFCVAGDAEVSVDRRLRGAVQPACRALRETLDAAIESGTASPYVDVDALFEFLRGATVVRTLTRGDDDAEDFCRQIAEALFTLVAATRR
jgi:hypothetical protein